MFSQWFSTIMLIVIGGIGTVYFGGMFVVAGLLDSTTSNRVIYFALAAGISTVIWAIVGSVITYLIW